jgi:hypothetical protein
MNKVQKEKVRELRVRGNSYADIGVATGLPVGTIKAYCSRNDIKLNLPEQKGACECCGKALIQQVHAPAKRFCSFECRNSWWHDNRDKRLRNGAAHVCAHCKKQYPSYDSESKYCSHPCYIAHRFGKGADQP